MSTALLIATLVATLVPVPTVPAPATAHADEGACFTGHVTGYVPDVSSGHITASGINLYTRYLPSIAATHQRFPFGTTLYIVELDWTLDVQDRGMLGWNDVDVAVWTLREAYNLTGEYTVCAR